MDRSLPTVTTLLDACAVLSLYATRPMDEIVASVVGGVGICDLVLGEALYVCRAIDGEHEREPVDLGPLIAGGRLQVCTAANDDELETFVDLAATLDDGEAMTAVLAVRRGLVLVTDDRKAERVLAGRVRLRPTLDVIKSWMEIAGIDDAALRQILGAIDDRGYRPPRSHPLKAWWDKHR